jgi:hypothetical protein
MTVAAGLVPMPQALLPGLSAKDARIRTPTGLPHRDLNCTRGVLASALLASTMPSS